MTGVLLSRAKTVGESFTSRIGMSLVDASTPPAVTQGTYYQTDGDDLQWVDVTQIATTTVNQASWNIDIFDGSGQSGKTLTIASAQENILFFMRQEWLGTGGITC